jgi:hypothetical protein
MKKEISERYYVTKAGIEMSQTEYEELKLLCQRGYRATDNNRWIYYYRIILNREPPHCSCSYGMMAIELREWLLKNPVNIINNNKIL